MRKPTVVLGLGNLLMSDDGIGVHVLQLLRDRYADLPDVEFIDAGTAGLSILHWLADRQKAILIDCARMGVEPATIKRFTPDQVRTTKTITSRSLHQFDLLSVIDLARRLDRCPAQIVIFAIEPCRLQPGTQLSATLARNLEHYVSTISRELLSPRTTRQHSDHMPHRACSATT